MCQLCAQGHEDKFVWGIEQSGAHRAYRILQKVPDVFLTWNLQRGAICDADDFKKVADTYPEHPISRNAPTNKTMAEVKETQKKAWDEANPASVPQKYKLSEYFVEKPA